MGSDAYLKWIKVWKDLEEMEDEMKQDNFANLNIAVQNGVKLD